jgi:membrane-bound ClpP family serine protease
MEPWIWAVLLLVLGLGLAMLEVLVPSGGLLGFLAVAAILGAIVVGFVQSWAAGLALSAAALVAVPVIVVFALRWWPHTPIGRRVLLGVPREQDILPDSPKVRDLKGLVGRVGRAKSQMLLSGAVVIDGRTYDAMSESQPIEEGQMVRVVQVRGTEIVVRPADKPPPPRPADDPLAQPIDTVTPDPFQDPPA